MKYNFSVGGCIALATLATIASTQEITPSNIQKIEKHDSKETIIKKAAHVVPTPRQMAYHKHEYISFIHFGPNTFSRSEWGNGKEDPTDFDLKNLDTDQWCRIMKAAQMTMVVLTCKHHDGFVLWQSRYTKHGVMSSPWLKGKGDILRELSKSCKKYGLKLGVYLSPADLYQIENAKGIYGNRSKYSERTIPRSTPGRPFKDKRTFKFTVDDYNEYFLNQLFELLTEYGPVHEVWFDGAHPKRKGGQKYNYAAWYELIHTLAPNAVIFGKGPDARWCGNEHGKTRSAEWNVIPKPNHPSECIWPDLRDDDLGSRRKLYKAKYLYYLPAETNTSIRHGWFYRDDVDQTVRSADDVFDIYERAVGGNTLFMLNIPPNRNGLFSERDENALIEAGKRIKQTYGTNLIKGAKFSRMKMKNSLESAYVIKFPEQTVNRFLIQEDIEKTGQRVEKHALDAMVDGKWKEVATGMTVGYKKILRFDSVTTNALRFRLLKSRLSPKLITFSAHYYHPRPIPINILRDKKGLVCISIAKNQFRGRSHGQAKKSVGKLVFRYTLDGTEPTATSSVYDKPFALTSGTVMVCSFSGKDQGAITTKVFGISNNTWKVHSVTSQHDGFDAKKAFDGNPKTFWQTSLAKGSPKHPHHISIDLGKIEEISGFSYLPRQGSRVPDSMVDKGRIEISTDGKRWTTVEDFEFGNLLNDPTQRIHRFKKRVNGRYFKFISTHGVADTPYAGAADIGVLGK